LFQLVDFGAEFLIYAQIGSRGVGPLIEVTCRADAMVGSVGHDPKNLGILKLGVS
jgi:hypothetical protein